MYTVNRLALFIPGFNGGGAENVFVILANYWHSQGIEVDFLVFSAEGPMRERLNSGVNVRVIQHGNSMLLRRLRIAWEIGRYCRQARPQLLFSTLTYCNISVVLAKVFFGVGRTRVILREANALDNIRKRGRLHSFLVLALMCGLYRWADAVTANSEHTIQQMMDSAHVPVRKCQLVRNPVPLQSLVNIKKKRDAPLVILGCGRLIPQKDFATLIRAVARVRQSVDCRLVILGEGPEDLQLQQLAMQLGFDDKSFELPGFVSNTEEYYHRASVFALSSKWEGLPNVVLEALSFGVPVVATDCSGGTREVFRENEEDFLVPVGDYVAMAERILSLLDCPRSRSEMQQMIHAEFLTEKVAESYLNLCKSTT